MTADTTHSKQLGAMIGGALGDAVGELASRGLSRESLLREVEREMQLRYTDNTALMLAVAETLVEFGGIDPQILGNRFQEYYHKERWRGYGDSMRDIQALVSREGVGHIDAAARLYDGAGSYGNGAATRITPLVLYYGASEALADGIDAAVRVTHAHPIALDGARVLAAAQVRAFGMNPHRPFSPQAFLEALIDAARTPEMRRKLELVAGLLDGTVPPPEAARRLELSTATHESIPFALYCFLDHPHEFMECVLAAVLHGGDRDTMGAVAGALSGAFLGIGAIPSSWRGRLENDQHIEALAHELVVRR